MRERNLIKKFSEKTNLLGGTFELPNYDALTDSDRRAVGDTVEVWFRQQEGTDKEVTIRYCNLALHKIG